MAVNKVSQTKAGARNWAISSTGEYAQIKVDLKAKRDELNRNALGLADVKEVAKVPVQQRPFKIVKGPDHPRLLG